jgi:phage repressor protein C with HTH and peptisase S24 domain|tara:strand:- start:277 stop:948 length:672 start_codon:yes stop_codon:yes gene_type:complete
MEELESSKIGRNLRKLRKQSGLSSEDMAKKVGISAKTVYNYETGKSRKIPQWVVEQYGDICGQLIDQSTEGHSTPIEPEQLGRPFQLPAEPGIIPIISMVAAGQMEFTDQGWGAGSSDEWLSRPHSLTDSNAYACHVSGDSMLPLLKPGMMVIASPNIPLDNIANGDLVIIKTVNMKVSVKEFHRKGDNTVLLKSWNDSYDDLKIPQSEIIFIHKVIWFRTRK